MRWGLREVEIMSADTLGGMRRYEEVCNRERQQMWEKVHERRCERRYDRRCETMCETRFETRCETIVTCGQKLAISGEFEGMYSTIMCFDCLHQSRIVLEQTLLCIRLPSHNDLYRHTNVIIVCCFSNRIYIDHFVRSGCSSCSCDYH